MNKADIILLLGCNESMAEYVKDVLEDPAFNTIPLAKLPQEQVSELVKLAHEVVLTGYLHGEVWEPLNSLACI